MINKLAVYFILLVNLLMLSCSDKEKEKVTVKDSIITDDDKYRDPKNYFKDCKALFAKAQKLDSILYTQEELDKNTANQAIKAFTDYAYYCKNDSLSPIFLIKTAQVALAINNVTQAKVNLEKCIQDYYQFEGIASAFFLLGQLYDEKEYLNNEEEARRIYQELIDRYPNSPEAESAKGAIKYLGMTDKEIINELKREAKSQPKVTIQ
ncbi:MAG: tetratricopeptide repeat protein [Sphingobacteriaceae bacterium]|nr:tetratricopeptide repeat protein [Sphingobacteriaceae bacterium]